MNHEIITPPSHSETTGVYINFTKYQRNSVKFYSTWEERGEREERGKGFENSLATTGVKRRLERGAEEGGGLVPCDASDITGRARVSAARW